MSLGFFYGTNKVSESQTIIEASSAMASKSAITTAVAGGTAAAGKFVGLDPVAAFGLLIGVGGLLVSVISFLITWHYKRQENKRAQEIHNLKKKELEGRCNVKN